MSNLRKILFTIFLAISICASTVYAEFYKLSLSKIDQDLYKDENTGYYFKTRYCYEYAYRESAVYNSDNNTVIFSDGSSYDVVNIFE